MARRPQSPGPILIVEDDPLHRELLRAGLDAAGFTYHLCADGQSALDWLADHAPSVVVSDWRLPGVHGVELLDGMRRLTDAPIVLLSAYPTDGRGAPGVVAAHMRKPFDMAALVETLERLAGRPAQPPRALPAADRALRVLLVEDNPADADLVAEALEALDDGEAQPVLEVVADGESALAHMRETTVESRPDVVLLDLNLPRLDGFSVLDALKSDPATRQVPVVMLTTSDDPHDIDEAYRRQVNCFVSKPFEIDHFIEVVQALVVYWSRIVSLPTR